MAIGDYYKLPVHTSYFSLFSYLDSTLLLKMTVATDILRQHFNNKEAKGEIMNVLAIEGYAEPISFKDLCLGLWMSFDILYGPYPYEPEGHDFIKGITGFYPTLQGWNGPITEDITLDIGIALKMIDELFVGSESSSDSEARLKAIRKWFYRNPHAKIFNFQEDKLYRNNKYRWEYLKTLNEKFYNWILASTLGILAEMSDAGYGKVVPNLYARDHLDHVFEGMVVYVMDATDDPDATDFKMAYKYTNGVWVPTTLVDISFLRNDDFDLTDLGTVGKALFKANKFLLRFLAVFEDLLYAHTNTIFPFKFVGMFSNLFFIYMRIVVNFVKPYHAKMLDTDATHILGDDIGSPVHVEDESSDYPLKIILEKKIYESAVFRLFDAVPDEMRHYPYDAYHGIREKLVFPDNMSPPV